MTSNSMRGMGVTTRHERILEFLAEPHTLKEIEALTGTSYYTARNDVLALINASKVRPLGELNGKGENLFVSGGKRPMPVFIVVPEESVSPNGIQLTLAEVATNFAKNPSMATSIAELRNGLQVALEIAYMATHEDADPKRLLEWRKIVSIARDRAKFLYDVYGGMLRDERVFDAKFIPDMKHDLEFDSEEVTAYYNRYLAWAEREEARLNKRESSNDEAPA